MQERSVFIMIFKLDSLCKQNLKRLSAETRVHLFKPSEYLNKEKVEGGWERSDFRKKIGVSTLYCRKFLEGIKEEEKSKKNCKPFSIASGWDQQQ
ncbi:hypothetical protein TNCT_241971 [Trichonephila clavata]|uniref:Uncharacterized protein n=1 Tax=Trichonephila clavata TaxID=2740835 RepID=A0A8X6GSS9_TRICU|nr:hypothetical protein TNCT_241971 [Trichonephila clavata]